MPLASLEALLAAYRGQAVWLIAKAHDLEQGTRKLIAVTAEGDIDISKETADEYRHMAGNLHAIIAAYERLHAKKTKRPEDQ